jgi:hypothetical protein
MWAYGAGCNPVAKCNGHPFAEVEISPKVVESNPDGRE